MVKVPVGAAERRCERRSGAGAWPCLQARGSRGVPGLPGRPGAAVAPIGNEAIRPSATSGTSPVFAPGARNRPSARVVESVARGVRAMGGTERPTLRGAVDAAPGPHRKLRDTGSVEARDGNALRALGAVNTSSAITPIKPGAGSGRVRHSRASGDRWCTRPMRSRLDPMEQVARMKDRLVVRAGIGYGVQGV